MNSDFHARLNFRFHMNFMLFIESLIFLLSGPSGLPSENDGVIKSYEDLIRIKSEPIAKYANALMVRSFSSKFPPKCINLYGTDNCFTYKDVINRHYNIQKQFSHHNLIYAGKLVLCT